MLRVAGQSMAMSEVEIIRPTQPLNESVGVHAVHTGGGLEAFWWYLLFDCIGDYTAVCSSTML